MDDLTIIIPIRETDNADITLESLKRQSYQNYKVLVIKDEGKGANYARNKGFKEVKTEFVLFSDNDICWLSEGIKTMIETLKMFPDRSYCYGAYIFKNTNWTLCNEEFSEVALKRQNYISTMPVIRTKDFVGFDESLDRFQDWDLWLTMLEQGKKGVYCGSVVFETDYVDHHWTKEQETEQSNKIIIKHNL